MKLAWLWEMYCTNTVSKTPVVSRAFSLVAFEDITCDMFEPRVRTSWLLRIITLVLLRVHDWTQAAAGTCTHLASHSVGVLLSPQAQDFLSRPQAQCTDLRAACMHTCFQRCFQFQPSIIEAYSSVPFLLGMCFCLLIQGEVGNVRGFFFLQTVWIPRLQKFAANFLVLEPKIVFFLVGWLVVIWYYFYWCISPKKIRVALAIYLVFSFPYDHAGQMQMFLYHSCTSFKGGSPGGQPLNIFTWYIGAGRWATWISFWTHNAHPDPAVRKSRGE